MKLTKKKKKQREIFTSSLSTSWNRRRQLSLKPRTNRQIDLFSCQATQYEFFVRKHFFFIYYLTTSLQTFVVAQLKRFCHAKFFSFNLVTKVVHLNQYFSKTRFNFCYKTCKRLCSEFKAFCLLHLKFPN